MNTETRHALTRAALGVAALATGALAVGCGDVSKADAVSSLSSANQSVGIPGVSNYQALAQCEADKLYDGGNFSKDEIQTVIKAADFSKLSSDLQARVSSQVLTPCLTQQIAPGATTTTSSSTAAAST
jgi:hypothetical protein